MSLQQSLSFTSIKLQLDDYYYIESSVPDWRDDLGPGRGNDPIEYTIQYLWDEIYQFDSLSFNIPTPSQSGKMDLEYNLEFFSEPLFPYNWEDFWVPEAT